MAADAETKTAVATREAAPSRPKGPRRFPPPQLRLHDRQVFVGFGATPLREGMSLTDLALIVPDVTFPFDIAGSAATRYQKKKCRFGYLDLELDQSFIQAAMARVEKACAEHVASLRLHLRASVLEGEGTLHGAEHAPFTFRLGFHSEGSAILACVYDVRLYGPSALPAPFLEAVLARAALRAKVVPDAAAFGAVGLSFNPVPALLRHAVPLRGFRLPETEDARLARIEQDAKVWRLHFEAGAPPAVTLDDRLLSCVEGSRTFRDAEALVAKGDLAAAEAAYLLKGETPDSHPFAKERLLALLAARSDAHDLALDVARGLERSQPGSTAALWTQGIIHLARGDSKEAGGFFQKLGELARGRGEEASAFQSFAAAGRAFARAAPLAASRAFQDALVLRPDDLGSLLELATAADHASDHEGAMRAYRRIAALARDASQAARAHVRLGELMERVVRDRASARLHYDAALRIAPNDPEALLNLSSLCQATGEPLRAIRCLDTLRATASDRRDTALESKACLRAGIVWEEGLAHPANALLRYREASELAPRDPQPVLRLAGLLEQTERYAEALEAWQRVVVLAEAAVGTVESGEAARAAAHRAHHALARIALERLENLAGARRHFEAALALVPDDSVALRALLPHWREEGRLVELARGCERCASVEPASSERAALLAEAGELLAGPLGKPARAEPLLEQALLIDPVSVRALTALASLAEGRSDGPLLCRLLNRLAGLAGKPAEKAARLVRLARAARDIAGDLDASADAFARALALEPHDLASRGELCAVHRRRGDESALAAALEAYAKSLEDEGELVPASGALRELARLWDSRFGRSADALALLERALVLSPENPEVLLDVGALSLRLGRAAAAREAFQTAIGLLPREASPERLSEIHARLGESCDALGDRAGALEAYATAFSTQPGDDPLAERLEALLTEAGRARDRIAVRMSRARAKRDAGLDGAAAAHFLAGGQLLLQSGEARQAEAAFRAALEADPDGPAAPAALEALCDLAIAADNPSGAAELLARRAAFHAEPRAAARALWRASKMVEALAPDRSHALLEAALARDSLFAPARARLAMVRLEEGNPAQALAHAEVALSTQDDPDPLSGPERVSLSRLASRAARAAGDLAAARAHLTHYCRAQATDVEALEELAALHREAGATDDLVDSLARLADRLGDGRAVGPLVELASVLGSLPERRDEKLRALRRALALSPDNLAALEGLAAALDRPAEAAERARVLARLVDLAEEPEEVSRRLCDCGEALLATQSWAEAATAFSKAARAGARPAHALERLAFAARAAQDIPLETEALTSRANLAARDNEPDAAERFFSLGLRHVELARPSDALAPLSRVLELSPSPSVERDALGALVEAHESQGDRASAAARLSRLANLLKGSEKAAALVKRAEHLSAMGDKAQAKDALAAALEASPGDRRAIQAMRALCRELGDIKGCADALEALLKLPQPDRREAASLAFELGHALRELGDSRGAEAALRRALGWDRCRTDAVEVLFELLLERGEIEEALPLGERSALRAARPADAARRFLRLAQLALSSPGDLGLALRYARRAAEHDPTDPAITSTLANVLYLQGAVSEALPLYRRLCPALGFDADREAAREAHLRLAELSLVTGDRALACDVLRRCLEQDPTWAAAADLLYETLAPTDPAAATAALARHARALSPGHRACTILLRAGDDTREKLESPAAAAELYQAARGMAEDPEHALRALDGLAAVQEQLGDATSAEQALLQAGELCARLGETARAARVFLRLGQLRLRSAEGSRAQAALEKALDLAPGLEEARTLLEEQLKKEDRFAELAASMELRASQAGDPAARASLQLEANGLRHKAGSRLRDRARELAGSGQKAAAVDALDEALRLSPDDVEALALRADLAGDEHETFDRRIVELAARGAQVPAPSVARAHFRLGFLAKQQGAEARSIEHLSRARELDPAGLAELFSGLASLAEDPQEASWARLERARVLDGARDGEAADAYLAIIRLGPQANGFAEAAERALALLQQTDRPREAAEASLARARSLADPAAASAAFIDSANLLSAWDARASLEALESAVAIAPQQAAARIALAAAYEAGGQPGKALDQLLAAQPLLPQESGERVELDRRAAKLARATGREPEAKALLVSLFERDAGDDDAFSAARGELIARQSLPELIAAIDRRIAALEPRGQASRSERLALLFEKGQLHADLEQSAESETAWRRALEIEPGHGPSLASLRELAAARGDTAELCDALQAEAAAAEPKAAFELWMRLGDTAANKLADPRRAAQAFVRACEVASGSDLRAAQHALAKALLQAKEPERALQVLERCGADPLQAGDDSLREMAVQARLSLGIRCEESGRDADALAHYSEAARRAPALVPPLEAMLRVAERLGLPEPALDASLKLLEAVNERRQPEQAAALHLKASEFLVALGRAPEAIKHLEVAVLRGAGGAAALKRLNELYLERGSWNEGAAVLTWYAARTEDEDEREGALRKAAQVYLERLSDPLQAAVTLEKALQERPGDRESLRQLRAACVQLCALGQEGEGLARLGAAAEATGDHERARLLGSARSFFSSAEEAFQPGLGTLAPGVRVDDALRGRIYEPAALGPPARFLRALAPALGAAWPDDIAGRGLSEANQIGPQSSPLLAARVRAAQAAVGLGALHAYLAPSAGVTLESVPGSPCGLIIGLGAVAGLDPRELAFVLVRSCELVLSGYPIALRAGDSGLAGLLACALSACGRRIEVPEPFMPARLSLVEALGAHPIEGLDELAKTVHETLGSLDAGALIASLERSASRVGLVVLGDAGAAMRATLRLSPPFDEADPACIDRRVAAERLSEIKDELLFCMRDDVSELRRACGAIGASRQ